MHLSKLYIDRLVADNHEVLQIQEQLNIPSEIIDPIKGIPTINSSDDDIQDGKSILLLTANKGRFIKPCPGTRYYTCCGYTILHIGVFCSMDCSYCIMQAYLYQPILQYFVNRAEMQVELENVFRRKHVSRIGTGEFTDSLIWEDVSDLNPWLVEQFACQNKAVLELKTKTINIERLQRLNHNRKTIVAWSVNTPTIIQSEENDTTSLAERLSAAAQCEAWGYPVAFHFDPMVLYDGCEEEYCQVLQSIFSSVSSENIVWISLGTFRFMPPLKPIIQKRFPESKIVYGEFIPGVDGKMRYFKPLRIRLYKQMVAAIRDMAPNVLVYYCMEDDEVWQKTTGFLPKDKGGLFKMLDSSAVKCCGLGAD